MKGVTTEVIAEVRARANIVDVVADVVVLKKSSKDYKGLCPFHNEKTPSFNVSPDKNIYKCFGCGEGGDVFAFIQKVKGLDFIDTVRELAHRFGVPLAETQDDRRDYDKRSLILMLYQQATEYYSRLLKHPDDGAVARKYLEDRGVTDEIIEKFKLGFAPSAWDGLLRYLTEANQISPSTLEEAGLIRKRNEGTGHYDLFRNRLMIPICDEQGRVIAFGGRTLGDDQVKYLNSPETPIYTKGQNLFAFHLAKDSIRSKDAVIVVEGYFDAITPHQYGFTNTVATLGTALTPTQAKMLVRYTDSKRVFLSFDSDAAGVKAVERGVETLNQVAEGVGIELRVLNVPGGKDPDECLRAPDGEARFGEALEEAPLLIDYQFAQALDAVNLQTHTGKIDGAKKVVPILSQIKNSVARGEYIRLIAVKIGLREEELSADVLQYRRDNRLNGDGRSPSAPSPNRPRPGSIKGGSPLDGTVEAERRLLALFLISKDDYDRVLAALSSFRLITPAHQRIKDAIHGIGSSFNNIEDLQHKLMDRMAPDQEASKALIEVILKAEEMRKQNAPVDVIIREARARLVKERLGQIVKQLALLLGQLPEDGDDLTLVQGKLAELTKLERNVLPFISNMSELGDLELKIDEVEASIKKFL